MLLCKRKSRSGFFVVFLIVGCGSGPSDRAAPADNGGTADQQSTDLNPISCEGLETSILATESTRKALRRVYGEPDSVLFTTQPNRHVAGGVDSLFGVFYRGLTVSLRVPDRGEDLVEHVVIRDNRFLRYPRIGISASESDLVDQLGPPTWRDSSAIAYDCGTGAEQPVRFHLHSGRVDSVQVHYYVD